MTSSSVRLRLAEGGPEREAIEAGQIDAVNDYASSNVILLPAARRALREAANQASAASREAGKPPMKHRLPTACWPPCLTRYQRLLAGLEALTLKFGELLHEPGMPIRYVYFPVDCVISLRTKVDGHPPLEVGLVGHEGMVGISLALGIDVSSVRALVQATGTAMRMEAAFFHKAFQQCRSLQNELYRYAYAKLALARQTVACNCFLAGEARLARWLLMTSDRVLYKEFFLTQAFLGDMLGVRRATVNEAACSLQQRKLIRYSRGNIRILDREGLEAASCRCYTRIEIPGAKRAASPLFAAHLRRHRATKQGRSQKKTLLSQGLRLRPVVRFTS